MPNFGPPELIIIFLILWIFTWPLSLMAVYLAWKKGYTPFKWIIYGLLVPFVAVLHASLLKTDWQAMENRQLADGHHIKCPYCTEVIKKGASVCRYCHRDLMS